MTPPVTPLNAERDAELQALRLDYFHVFSTEEGQRVLRDIEASGYVTRQFPVNVEMGVYEGARRLALGIRKNYERGRDEARHVARQTHAPTGDPYGRHE